MREGREGQGNSLGTTHPCQPIAFPAPATPTPSPAHLLHILLQAARHGGVHHRAHRRQVDACGGAAREAAEPCGTNTRRGTQVPSSAGYPRPAAPRQPPPSHAGPEQCSGAPMPKATVATTTRTRPPAKSDSMADRSCRGRGGGSGEGWQHERGGGRGRRGGTALHADALRVPAMPPCPPALALPSIPASLLPLSPCPPPRTHPVVLAGVVGAGGDAPRAQQARQLVGILLEGAVHNGRAHRRQRAASYEQRGDALAGGLAGATTRGAQHLQAQVLPHRRVAQHAARRHAQHLRRREAGRGWQGAARQLRRIFEHNAFSSMAGCTCRAPAQRHLTPGALTPLQAAQAHPAPNTRPPRVWRPLSPGWRWPSGPGCAAPARCPPARHPGGSRRGGTSGPTLQGRGQGAANQR